MLKALNFIRFEADDIDASFMAGSPYIVDLFVELAGELKSKEEFPSHIKQTPLEKLPRAMEAIKRHIRRCDNWNELDLAIRKDLLQNLTTRDSKEQVRGETLDYLMEYGNMYHKKL